VIAAEVTIDSPDFGHLGPMVAATERELVEAGVSETPEVVVADAGYWHQAQMEDIVTRGIQVLVPPDADKRKGPRPGWDGGLYSFMRRVLATDLGAGLYGKTPRDDRAGLRRREVQPPDRPLPTSRQVRVPVGVAPHRGDAQPSRAPRPPDGRRGRLTGPVRLARPHRNDNARAPRVPPRGSLQDFRNSHHGSEQSGPCATRSCCQARLSHISTAA
jgi:hypothetical protein